MKYFVLFSTVLLAGCAARVVFQFPREEMKAASQVAEKLPRVSSEISYLVSGEAAAETTVFFVHGTPGEAGNWGRFLADEELQKKFRMISFDRLGFGGSNQGMAESELRKQAAALAKVAGARSGRRVWVGHSYGVPVIARVAADFPELVDAAVLVAGPAGPKFVKKTWYQSLAATSLGQAVISQDLKTANIEMIHLEGELEKLEPAWAEMNFPISIIHAQDDILAKFGSVGFLRERLPDEGLKIRDLEKGNHFLIWSHKDMVVEEIKRVAWASRP